MSYERDLTLSAANRPAETWDGSTSHRAWTEETFWQIHKRTDAGWKPEGNRMFDVDRAMKAVDAARRDEPGFHRLVRCIVQTKVEMEVVG